MLAGRMELFVRSFFLPGFGFIWFSDTTAAAGEEEEEEGSEGDGCAAADNRSAAATCCCRSRSATEGSHET